MRPFAASLMAAAGVPLEHAADVLGRNGTRMAPVATMRASKQASEDDSG